MTIELKACPFCGGEGQTCQQYQGFTSRCKACECELGLSHYHGEYCGVFDTREEAAEAWNTRT